MYTYQYAVGRYRDYQSGFHIVDISLYKLKDLIKIFNLLDIIVYDDFYNRNVKLDLDDYLTIFSQREDSIIDFLKDNKDNVLKYHLDFFKNEYQYARWESLYHKGFYPHPANHNLANNRESSLTSEAAIDIRLIYEGREYTDYKKLVDYSLFIMNGCFIRAYGNSDAIYLLEAGLDYQHILQDIYVSAINFEKLGKVTTIPITKEMIRRDITNSNNKYFIDLNNSLDLSDKTIWLVFNGQLCVNDDIIRHIGNNTIHFSPEYMDILGHYMNYKEFTRTPAWIDQNKRDKYIEECLIMHNSFIVIIDNPTIGVDTLPLTDSLWPTSAHTNDKFEHPLMLETGLFPYVYRRSYGFSDRLINYDIRHCYNRVIESVGNLSTNMVYDTVNTGQVGKLPKSYFFKITGLEYVY